MAEQVAKLELKLASVGEQSSATVAHHQRAGAQQYTHIQSIVESQAAEGRQLLIRLEAEAKSQSAQQMKVSLLNGQVATPRVSSHCWDETQWLIFGGCRQSTTQLGSST